MSMPSFLVNRNDDSKACDMIFVYVPPFWSILGGRGVIYRASNRQQHLSQLLQMRVTSEE